MSATDHSHRAWILVDPVQDYEESLKILGVYGTDEAGRIAARMHIRNHPDRDLQAQEWRGDDLLRVWTWSWHTRLWTLCHGEMITPCRVHDHAACEVWRHGQATVDRESGYGEDNWDREVSI